MVFTDSPPINGIVTITNFSHVINIIMYNKNINLKYIFYCV